jgi:hypothetical protein
LLEGIVAQRIEGSDESILPAKGNHWLGVKLVGKQATIDAIGAR